MVARQRLNAIQERKRLLLAEAEIHRAVVDVEVEGLRDSLGWVDSVRKVAGKGLPWLPMVAAVSGLLVARKSKSVLGVVRSGLAVLPLVSRWLRRSG